MMQPDVIPRSGQRGLSLIEVLVAVAILGFVALGIASLFSYSMVSNASGFDYALLASEARRALETLKAVDFEDAALDDTGTTPVAIQTRLAGYVPHQGFDVTFTAQAFHVDGADPLTDMSSWDAPGAASPANLRRITVSVRSRSSILIGQRNFVATTLLARG